MAVAQQMRKADMLGRAEVSISEIMSARSWTVTKNLEGHTLHGSVTIKGSRPQAIRPLWHNQGRLPDAHHLSLLSETHQESDQFSQIFASKFIS
jgi:hypothetical protein